MNGIDYIVAICSGFALIWIRAFTKAYVTADNFRWEQMDLFVQRQFARAGLCSAITEETAMQRLEVATLIAKPELQKFTTLNDKAKMEILSKHLDEMATNGELQNLFTSRPLSEKGFPHPLLSTFSDKAKYRAFVIKNIRPLKPEGLNPLKNLPLLPHTPIPSIIPGIDYICGSNPDQLREQPIRNTRNLDPYSQA